MTHQHLCFQSLHSLQSNTHNDDNGSTTDCQALHIGSQDACHDGQQGNDSQIHSTENQDLVDNLLDEISGGLAGAEARDEATVLLQVVGNPRDRTGWWSRTS